MRRYILTSSNNIVKLAAYSRDLGELASKSSSRLEAGRALAIKTSADRLLVSELEKIAFGVMDSIQSAKNSDLLKGLLFGTGAAVPLAAAGKYVSDEASDRAEALGHKAMAAAPLAILAGIAASKALRNKDSSVSREKTSEFLAAYSLKRDLEHGSSMLKTASDIQYSSSILDRCNAHIADIVSDIIL